MSSQNNNNNPSGTVTQKPVSLFDMCLKCIFDSQNNINTLIRIQEQQMTYINGLLHSLEKKNNVEQQQQQQSNGTNNQNPQDTTTTDQSSNTEPIPPQD